MKFKHLAQMFLSLCLAAQLNFAEANNNYDEEITLPVGTNFDLEMEEITRYEYDGNYVKAQTVNGKEQFILQKTGDTIINVIMEENGQKTEMRVLVHIVTEQQFNGTEPAKPATTTAPAAKPAVPTKPATQPAATTPAKPAKPAATTPAPAQTKPSTTTPAATQPKASAPAKAATPAKPAATTSAKTATEPAKAAAPTTTVTEPAKVATPAATTPTAKPVSSAAPVAPTYKVYGTAISRPVNIVPANTIEAAKLKAQNLSFDVLDLVNAERAKAGLVPLTMTKDLMDVALLRSKEIPKRFSHTRPDNTRYFTAMTMQGTVREENIAAGQTTAEAVVKAWMAAPNSKEIILNPAFRELGVGYFETVGASYNCYWVQIFRG